MTLEEYVDIIEHSDFEWGSGYGEDRCVGGDAYYTYNGITKPLIGYRERAWRSSKRDCYYPSGVMVFYERDGVLACKAQVGQNKRRSTCHDERTCGVFYEIHQRYTQCRNKAVCRCL